MKTSESISYNYRLAESIFNPNPFPKNLNEIVLSNFKNSILYHYINLSSSDYILSKYLSVVGNQSVSYLNDFHPGILNKIFHYLERVILKYDPNFHERETIETHSFHCRVGDVIDCCELHSVDEHLLNPISSNQCRNCPKDPDIPLSSVNKTVYVAPLSHFSNSLCKHITLVAGGCFHENLSDKKSNFYCRKILKHFVNQGKSTYLRYRQNEDEDFLYLLKSKHFTGYNSRFSELVKYFKLFLEKRNSKKQLSSLAIFYPCTYQEYTSGKLEDCFRRMLDSAPTDSYVFDVFFVFNQIPNEDSVKLNIYEKSECINKIYIHNLNLDPEEDIYKKPWDLDLPNSIPRLGLSSGPNLSFYRSLNFLQSESSSYSHFLLIETDVYFTKQKWFDSVYKFCLDNDFLIAGSTYKGNNEYHKSSFYKKHLNGVALYSNKKELSFVLEKTEELHNQWVSSGNIFLNFDIALEIFRQKDNNNLISGKNVFLDTDFITNFNDSKYDKQLNNEEVLSRFPNTLILHKK